METIDIRPITFSRVVSTGGTLQGSMVTRIGKRELQAATKVLIHPISDGGKGNNVVSDHNATTLFSDEAKEWLEQDFVELVRISGHEIEPELL